MAKILIADDDRNVLFLIRHLLNENGYETAEALNGLAALEMFQTQFFSLIITDVRMPEMDGMCFLSEVKKLEPTTPVIVLTAYDSTETACEAMKNGAFVYLTKPFKTDALLNAVRRALSLDKATASTPQISFSHSPSSLTRTA